MKPFILLSALLSMLIVSHGQSVPHDPNAIALNLKLPIQPVKAAPAGNGNLQDFERDFRMYSLGNSTNQQQIKSILYNDQYEQYLKLQNAGGLAVLGRSIASTVGAIMLHKRLAGANPVHFPGKSCSQVSLPR